MLSLSRHIRLPAFVALLTFTIAACTTHSWKTVTDPGELHSKHLLGADIRILKADSTVLEIHVTDVSHPFVHGYISDPHAPSDTVMVDLREVIRVDVAIRDTTRGPKIVLITIVALGFAAGVFFLGWLLVSSNE